MAELVALAQYLPWSWGQISWQCSGKKGEKSYPTPKVRVAAKRSNRMFKERQLHGCRRAQSSYSMFKVRRGSREEVTLVQGKAQRLRFAGAAVKRYHTSKARETQVGW